MHVLAITFRVSVIGIAITTQRVHRLEIRPIVHNKGASSTTPPS